MVLKERLMRVIIVVAYGRTAKQLHVSLVSLGLRLKQPKMVLKEGQMRVSLVVIGETVGCFSCFAHCLCEDWCLLREKTGLLGLKKRNSGVFILFLRNCRT